ncbi:short-chain dehydrogenase [Dendryphion nanum]|uniref:Short-chain dehydrogenase n=1 Tax=Dendryphion nanum TaxID=256645 RepID=A0A9P9ID17_9PLEO|nr:short-chain dehydrogenase [Dendryphion nanum]
MSNRYASAHENPKGPGDARPTALQIVQDNDLIGKLTGKVAVVTGASSGIGIPTALALKATGARVFAAVRDLEKGKKALGEALEPGHLELVHLDLNSFDSVRKCAAEILSKTSTLNILINNAGIMATPEGRTADGHELQFGTNHLAHFLLFQLLKPALLASASPEFGSRVVSVSSVGHRNSEIHFDNLKLEGIYQPWLAYGQAKLANVYLANEIERRYGSQNLHAFSLHPGGIWTGLQIHVEEQVAVWKDDPKAQTVIKSPEQGAATSIWAALDKSWEGKGGLYLEECQVSQPYPEGSTNMLESGYATNAYDEEAEKKLWKVSSELVGVEE